MRVNNFGFNNNIPKQRPVMQMISQYRRLPRVVPYKSRKGMAGMAIKPKVIKPINRSTKITNKDFR